MRTLVVLLSVLAASGCKSDKSKQAPAQAGSAGSGAASTRPDPVPIRNTGSAGDQAKAADLQLPKGPGTPPTKTTKPLTVADFEKLAALEYPGFKAEVREKDKHLEVRHTTPRPMLSTTVSMMACFDCLPMELAAWKAKEDGMKGLLPTELRDRPDTTFELGATELHGATLIYTYQFGHHFGVDEQNNPVGVFSNAYALYYNDGVNQIRVVSQYKDDPVAREDMLKIAPREDLEKLARAFLDAYTHAW